MILIIIIIIIIIINKLLYCASKCRSIFRGADHCTSAGRITSILRHIAEAFPPARQGTILNNHRVISIANNISTFGAKLHLSDLFNDDSKVGLPDDAV